MFMGVKAAFDLVKKKSLWHSMGPCKIRKGLIEWTKEINEETKNVGRNKGDKSK